MYNIVKGDWENVLFCYDCNKRIGLFMDNYKVNRCNKCNSPYLKIKIIRPVYRKNKFLGLIPYKELLYFEEMVTCNKIDLLKLEEIS